MLDYQLIHVFTQICGDHQTFAARTFGSIPLLAAVKVQTKLPTFRDTFQLALLKWEGFAGRSERALSFAKPAQCFRSRLGGFFIFTCIVYKRSNLRQSPFVKLFLPFSLLDAEHRLNPVQLFFGLV